MSGRRPLGGEGPSGPERSGGAAPVQTRLPGPQAQAPAQPAVPPSAGRVDGSQPLAIALQEWASCCRALGSGRVLLTLRKGGIHERGGALFAPEHERFLLLPTHLHQDAARLSPALAAEAPPEPPAPGRLRLELWAEVVRTWKVEDLVAAQALGPELPFSAAEIETRFRYRGQPFIHVLALRVKRLPVPLEIADDPAYAGCRSWITLREPVATAGSAPVVGTGVFDARLERIADIIGRPRGIVRH